MIKNTQFSPWSVILTIGILTLAGSCYYDVEEDLYPSSGCQTTDISYTQDILPILQNSCLSCHNQVARNGNIILEGYSNVIVHVNNGALLGVIKHLDGWSPMPQNQPRLVDCQIAKIEQWVTDGAPNN